MNVPYISQLEPDGNGYANCGPACLAMLLAYDGVIGASREDMHRVADYIRDRAYDGDWWLGTYTDYPMMRWYLEHELGIGSAILRSWDEVADCLDDDRPVMILVDNVPLEPRQYPRSPAWNAHHFIVLASYDIDPYFLVNDPLALYDRGPGAYTIPSVHQGAANVGGVYALVLEKKESEVSPEDQAILDVMHGLGANAASIEGWINEIGALNADVAGKQGEIDQLNGITIELQSQVDALREEVAALKATHQASRRVVGGGGSVPVQYSDEQAGTIRITISEP